MLNQIKEGLLAQPEKIYALFSASMLSVGIIFGFNLGALASVGALAISCAVGLASIPVFRFVIQIAKKLKLMMDHVDEVVVKAKTEMDELKTLKESLKTTLNEANETLSELKKTTIPEGNKAISETSKAVKELQVLVDDISKKTLPAINSVAGDVHDTMEFVNSGAQTASTLLAPVTGAGKLLRKAGNMVGLGQGEKAVKQPEAEDQSKAMAPVTPQNDSPQKSKRKAVATRAKNSTKEKVPAQNAPTLTVQQRKTKKDQAKLKEIAKKTTEQAPTEEAAPGYLSYFKFW